jgi:CheY-like chemotaxis protein
MVTGRPGATILVVEDEPALRRTALRILGKLGYQVVLAERGEEALERLRLGQAFELVISDYHLPDTDGWRLLASLRAAGYAGGFVLTSGSDEEDLAGERPLEAGVPFLGKPFAIEELARVVREVLERHKPGEDGP